MNRVRVADSSEERKTNPDKPTALENTIRSYIENKRPMVVDPSVGTTFDSLDEAYSFYNLYSWEIGFGIRYGKSRLNVHKKKCMQEILCGCSVSLLISAKVLYSVTFVYLNV